jgi:hypothetical protein
MALPGFSCGIATLRSGAISAKEIKALYPNDFT